MIGLAPIRPDLKGRLRELLCIHGQKGDGLPAEAWSGNDDVDESAFALSSYGVAAFARRVAPGEGWSPRLVSRQRLLVFSEALICLSYSGETGPPSRSRPAKAGCPAR